MYKLSFFIIITIIGLNLILGIIIDTFSELRDKKVSTRVKLSSRNSYFALPFCAHIIL